MSEIKIKDGFYKIRPAGRHILAIGRDLIKDKYAAIVELVKNSYDADSLNCTVSLLPYEKTVIIDNKEVLEKGITVIVKDEGHGMTFDTVTDKWMVPSTDDKLTRENKGKSPNGRLMQGKKGIGRYSASIIGDDMVLETIDDNGELTTLYLIWDDFEKAKDKIMMGAERKSMVMDEHDRKVTAYHESGHAIVGYLSPEHNPIYKVTIIPRGRSLGVTMSLPVKDEISISKTKLESQIAMAYGGRIAEEILGGKDAISTGASSDIQQATNIARNMVTKWGFGDGLGQGNNAGGEMGLGSGQAVYGNGNGDGVGEGGQGTDTGAGTTNLKRKVINYGGITAQSQEEGKVAIDIWVNDKGEVVKTRFNPNKSNSPSSYLIGLATKWAKTMQYEKLLGAPTQYVGTQVFNFTKQ